MIVAASTARSTDARSTGSHLFVARSRARRRGARRRRSPRAAHRAARCAPLRASRTRRRRSSARATPRAGCRSPTTRDEVGAARRDAQRDARPLERARERERRFLADASHELRTPLTALRGNAAYVARHGADPAVLADLEADAARLARLPTTCSRWRARTPARRVRDDAVDLVALAARAPPADEARVDARAPGVGPRRRAARSSARSRTCRKRARARAAGRADHRRRSTRGTDALDLRRATRARASRPSDAERAFERFWRGRTAEPARGSASRSCGRPPSATAAASMSRARGSRSSSRALRRCLRDRRYNVRRSQRKDSREMPPHALDSLACSLVSSPPSSSRSAARRSPSPRGGGSGPTPPPSRSTRRSTTPRRARRRRASPPASASRTTCFPSGALPRPAGSRADRRRDGRLWLTNDGRVRLELQSDAGDAQIVWNRRQAVTVYDASSNTVYKLDAAADQRAVGRDGRGHAADARRRSQVRSPTLGRQADLSGATPTDVAGQPAYTREDLAEARRRPARRRRARLGRRPRRAAARGDLRPGQRGPVLELTATDISYGAVARRRRRRRAAGRREGRRARSGRSTTTQARHRRRSTGSPPSSAQVASPSPRPTRSSACRARTSASSDGDDGALVVYGQGLGAIVVLERKADAPRRRRMLARCRRSRLDGATGHELADRARHRRSSGRRDGVALRRSPARCRPRRPRPPRGALK